LQSPKPLDTRPLFLPLHEELMALLRGLSAADWERPTRAGAWTVRDVVAHLLDGDVRRLTFQRDGAGWPGPEPAAPTFDALVPFLDRLNAEWIAAAQRLSPRVLVDFLAVTAPQVASLFASLAPEGRAFVGVAWAGEDEAPNWLDVGREYTERWHHQQQIREAVSAPLQTAARWLSPVLAVSVRALPRVYAATAGRNGDALELRITGEAGGVWSLVRAEARWELFVGPCSAPKASLTVDEDAAWRIFFKALPEEDAQRRVSVVGDASLARPFLTARAVMA
jgi:uncharacterized protein (TIGR03083 family)